KEIKGLTDQQIELARDGRLANANEYMLEAARIRRSTPDFAGTLSDHRRRQQDQDLDQIATLRSGLTLVMVVVSMVIVALGGYTVWRIEQSLRQSINREMRRTEALIAGMSDGVMLADREGKPVYFNPAAERLLGQAQVGVPIEQHADVYHLF